MIHCLCADAIGELGWVWLIVIMANKPDYQLKKQIFWVFSFSRTQLSLSFKIIFIRRLQYGQWTWITFTFPFFFYNDMVRRLQHGLGHGIIFPFPFSFKMIMFRRLQHGPQRCGDPWYSQVDLFATEIDPNLLNQNCFSF